VHDLEVLFESEDMPSGVLPLELRATYGGDLGFDEPLVYANLVASIDGIAAERTRFRSSLDISGGNPSDRFVMGLLRACADAVVIGAGTLRAHPVGAWTAEHAYPAASKAYARLRALRGLPPQPRLVVLSASGDVPFNDALWGSIVISSEHGVSRLPDVLIEHAEVRVADADERGLDVSAAIEALRADGYTRILTEGGPRLMGSLLGARAIDELFLTVSPIVAGRISGDRRPGVIDRFELQPGEFRTATLRSIRRNDSFLFIRYGLT